jgi:hypothetical protein
MQVSRYFNLDELAKQESRVKEVGNCFHYSLTLKMDATCSYELCLCHCVMIDILLYTVKLTFVLIIGLCILLRVYQLIYVETSVCNRCLCSFYYALLHNETDNAHNTHTSNLYTTSKNIY